MADKVVLISKNFDSITKNISGFEGKFKKQGSAIFRKFVTDIYNDITLRSPVDKSDYRNSWDLHLGGGGGEIVSSVGITNNMPYAPIMETGSVPGEKPWPVAGKRFKKKGILQDSKTVEKDGKIWSKQMPESVAGGAVDNADWDSLVKRLSDIILK